MKKRIIAASALIIILALTSCGPGEAVGYFITFDDSRGISERFNTYIISGVGITDTEGKLTSMPTPYKVGYTFMGWYTSVEGTGDAVTIDVFDDEGAVTKEGTRFTKDTTLYAAWEQLSLNVPNGYPNGPNITGLTSPSIAEHTFDVTAESFKCQFGLTTDATNVRRSMTMSPMVSDIDGVVYHYEGMFHDFSYFAVEAHLYFYGDGTAYTRVGNWVQTEGVGTWTKSGDNIIFSTTRI